MVNELLVTYGIYRIGSLLFFPLVIVGALLLFTPVGWLILGSIWFLSNVAKSVEEQVALEDAQNATEGAPDQQGTSAVSSCGSADTMARP